MALLTKSLVRGWARSRLAKSSWRTDSVIIKEASAQVGSFDVFLSHCYLDKELVSGLYTRLTEYGLTVYVDWVEDAVLDRTHVTSANAHRIRRRIRSSSSVLFAISQNAGDSVWMPWEVGVGDGAGKKVAVIPVVEDINLATQTVNQEYLGLYPTVDYVESNGNPSFWVNFSHKDYAGLSQWLSS